MNNIQSLLEKSVKAKSVISNLSTELKNEILSAMSNALIKNSDKIIIANKKDYKQSKKNGLSSALLDRLLLNKQRIKKMAQAIEEIALLSDPIGEIVSGHTRPNGLKIRQIRVPIGVILSVFGNEWAC